MRATQHFHHGLLLSTPKEKKRKEIKLFTRESSQQAKEEREIFLGFLLITTTIGMESKLAKIYNYFFWFFLRFFKHTRRRLRKENKLAWIVQ